jgi:hypothetical protein
MDMAWMKFRDRGIRSTSRVPDLAGELAYSSSSWSERLEKSGRGGWHAGGRAD